MDELDVESLPEDDQKERLEDFLTELMFVTRRYGLLLLDPGEELNFVDMRSGRLVGVGLAAFTAPDDDHKVIGYVAVDSIMDGTWMVDGTDGPVEQRHVMNVFPRRDPE